GEFSAHATIHNISVQCLVFDDAGANIQGLLKYREVGEKDWWPAFPLHRAPARPNQPVKFLGGLDNWVPHFAAYGREHLSKNYFAGSIFNLKPNTQYELLLFLRDANDPRYEVNWARIGHLTVSTREIPEVVHLKTRLPLLIEGGGDALKNALENAKPGSHFFVAAGTYNGDITISANSTDENPILIIANGEVLIDGGPITTNNDKTNGITVTGANVRMKGLAFRNFHTCIKAEPTAKNLVIQNCKFEHFYNGITVYADDATITDNSVRYSYRTTDMSITGGQRKNSHGIQIGTKAKGGVIAYNEISLVADAIHAIGRDIDVHNNDVIFCLDDAIELDFGGPNIRVYDNRFSYSGHNGISFQPYIGGPAYILRNCVFGPKDNALKTRYDADSVYFINNTFISRDSNGCDLPFGSFTRNNIFLVSPGKTRSARIDLAPTHMQPNMDYDLFGPVGPNGLTLAEFTTQTGMENNGIQATSNAQVLATFPLFPPEYESPQWVYPEAYLKATTRSHPDYSLAKDSPAIGKGIPIPNITIRLDGKPIDLGALQHDQPAPHYGPRR
ncbi:MAG: right-handed parallel beta-helix repeat-containing protein, partial [Phycisphaerales bacterium]|nr:right-handed parallel beta-helix repeat-containing protein [Phycisphaerales bacterium]